MPIAWRASHGADQGSFGVRATLNCKPGDLAIMIAGKQYAGRLVEVLYTSPRCLNQLPDGYWASGSPADYWVCQSLGSPFEAPVYCGATGETTSRSAMYASIADWALRPLRGDEAGEACSDSRSHS